MSELQQTDNPSVHHCDVTMDCTDDINMTLGAAKIAGAVGGGCPPPEWRTYAGRVPEAHTPSSVCAGSLFGSGKHGCSTTTVTMATAVLNFTANTGNKKSARVRGRVGAAGSVKRTHGRLSVSRGLCALGPIEMSDEAELQVLPPPFGLNVRAKHLEMQ